ncbi:MAG TPA: ArsR family transcriptional regulator [Candidatus Nitrosocosmicus sp.]|nr:ArsR family transcriptional regulator [Candidatus Nitrosocosmicus sp.]
MGKYNNLKSETFSQSDPKRKILYYLKVMNRAGLNDLSKAMKISRMAVHKHLSDLQDRGLVESIEIRKGVGRPTMQYSLSSTGKTAFPKSYGEIAIHALDYLEKKMGKDAVESVLRERQKELVEKYSIRMKDMEFDDKVKELARIRDEEGYIAESKKDRKRNFHTLLEYNCPIIMIAEKHWEACSIETELFENILDAKVEVTHRAAKGDSICKFLIKETNNFH